MKNLEIVEDLDIDAYEIEDNDYSERYPAHLFDKISTHMYRNKSNSMLHIADIPITSETKHRYIWWKVEKNLKAQGIDTSKYNKNKYDLVYVGNPIEEVEKALPALTGMKAIKKHSKIDVSSSPKKDLHIGHLTNVNIKTVKNRLTAVADQLIIDDEKTIDEIVKSKKRGLSSHWHGKFVPIELSPYKEKEFYSDRYKNEVVEFVKVDLQPNNLSHVLRQNDELCVIQDEDVNNLEDINMEQLEQSLLSKIGNAIKDAFKSNVLSEITDEDAKEKIKKVEKSIDKDEEEEKEDIEKDKDKPEADKRAKKSLEEDKDRKSEIEDSDISNELVAMKSEISELKKQNEDLQKSLKLSQEIADEDAEIQGTNSFITGLHLGSRGNEIINDTKLSSSDKLNHIAKGFDFEIADEDLNEMDIAGKMMLIKQLHKVNKLKISNSIGKKNMGNHSNADSKSDEILKDMGL